MSIKNKQLENKPKVYTNPEVPSVGAGQGAFYPKVVGGVAEGFYKDSNGVEIQFTEGGILKVPPSAAGEVNDGLNLVGIGEEIFAGKTGLDLQFKRLSAGNNVSLVNLGTSIRIDVAMPASFGEANSGVNIGAQGLGIYKAKDGVNLQFRKLIAGSNVDLQYSATTDEIIISATGSGFGETNTASNVGTGYGIYTRKISANLEFKTLKAGANITMTPSGDGNELLIAAAGGTGEVNVGANLGSGAGIYFNKTSSTLNFKSLVAGAGITLTPTDDSISIAANAGTGEANDGVNLGINGASVYDGKDGVNLQFRKIEAGTGILVEQLTNSVRITNTGGGTGGTDELLKVSSVDTTAGYLQAKISAGSNISLTKLNPGANEQLQIAFVGTLGEINTVSTVGTGASLYKDKVSSALRFKSIIGVGVTVTENADDITLTASGGGADEQAKVSSADTTSGYLESKVVAGTNVTITKLNTGGNEQLQISSTGGGASVYEYAFTLPPAATLADRFALVEGLPSGWTLATAATAGIGEFSNAAETLVITHGLSKVCVGCWINEVVTGGPTLTQGYRNINLSEANSVKTSTNKNSIGVINLETEIITTAALFIYVKLI